MWPKRYWPGSFFARSYFARVLELAGARARQARLTMRLAALGRVLPSVVPGRQPVPVLTSNYVANVVPRSLPTLSSRSVPTTYARHAPPPAAIVTSSEQARMTLRLASRGRVILSVRPHREPETDVSGD